LAKAIDELRYKLRDRGYDTVKDSKGHWAVMRNGNVMRTDAGQPITLPSTISDPRAIKNVTANLRKAGILPTSFTQSTSKIGKRYPADSEKVRDLRQMLIEVMKEYDLAQIDVYTYADYYHSQHGLPVTSSGQGLVSKLVRGTTGISDISYDYLRRTLDLIIDANGKIPRADEIRQMSTTPAPQPDEGKLWNEEDMKDEGVQITGDTKAKFKPPEITLAFEVMQLFYTEERDPDVILDLCRRIAKLELS